MQFKSYDEVIAAERIAGQDLLLGSLFNFASPDEQEFGVGLYLGQGDDIGDRAFLAVDQQGLGTLVLSNGQIVAQSFPLEDRLDLLSQMSWLVSLD